MRAGRKGEPETGKLETALRTNIPVPGPPFQPLPFLAIQQQPDPGAADKEVINQE